MTFTDHKVLSWVVDAIYFITPAAIEVEPSGRGERGLRGWKEEGGGEVVGEHSGVKEGVPKGAGVGVVGEQAEGDNVFLFTGSTVHGVCADGGVYNGLTFS